MSVITKRNGILRHKVLLPIYRKYYIMCTIFKKKEKTGNGLSKTLASDAIYSILTYYTVISPYTENCRNNHKGSF